MCREMVGKNPISKESKREGRVAVDTTPSVVGKKKLSAREGADKYMKNLLREMRAAEKESDSPDEIVELDTIKKTTSSKLKATSEKPEKFGDYALPLKHLQDAFKPSPELHF